MGRKKVRYELVGRTLNNKEATAYKLKVISGNKVGEIKDYTPEQMAYLVGSEQVVNYKAQIYKDKVIFRTGEAVRLQQEEKMESLNKTKLITAVDEVKKSLSKHLETRSVQINKRNLNSIMQFRNDRGNVLDVFIGVLEDGGWTFRTDVDSITIGEEQVEDITKDLIKDRIKLLFIRMHIKDSNKKVRQGHVSVEGADFNEERILKEIARSLGEIGCVEISRERHDNFLGVIYENKCGAVTLYITPQGSFKTISILAGLDEIYFSKIEANISENSLNRLSYEMLEEVRKVLK